MMKKLTLATAFILAIASFGSAAYANVDSSNTNGCRSIPIAKPSGGATRERMAAIESCNAVRSKKQQTLRTSQTTQPTAPSEERPQTRQNQEHSNSDQPNGVRLA